MQGVYTYDNQRLRFAEGLCNFNGNVYLTNNRIKSNHKYLVYSKETEQPIRLENIEEMTLLDNAKEEDFQFIFYVDSHNRLSFVKSKYHKFLSEQELIDKIEKMPFFRSHIFGLFQSLFFFGVLRFRFYSFEDIELSLGYDKSLNAKVHFLFPKKIRSKFSMYTNKFHLLLHIYWCRIPLKALLKQYKENSHINVPVFVKVKNKEFNYYYSFKKKNKDKYNKKHYLYNTLSYTISRSPIELFVRKSITGQYVIVFTSILNKKIKQIEKVAFLCSVLSRDKEQYNIYFEKFCEGASESAFELFKLAVTKDKKAVYILSRDGSKSIFWTQIS